MDTSSQLNTVKARPLIKQSLLMLDILGIDPYNYSIWSKIRAAVGICILTYLNLELFLQFLINWNGWVTVDGFIIFTSLVQMTFKLAFMSLKKKQFCILLQHMEEFWSWDNLDNMLRNTFDYMAALAIRAMKLFYFAAMATLLLLLLRPLFETNKTLPFDSYHPTDRKSNYYIPMYILQAVDPAWGAVGVIAFDSFFVSLVIHIICQIRVMKHRFLAIKIDLSENEDDRSSLAEFQNLIRHHVLVLKCIKIMSEIYSNMLLGQFASSVSCICSSLLNMVQFGYPPDMQRLLTYAIFTSAILFQLFIYCLIGTFLKEESLSLSEAAYGWDWWAKTQPKLRMASVLIIQRAQKIETLKAGAIFPLDLESFTNILRFFLSFFTVAQGMYTNTSQK